jgi:hypothetical protein
MKLIAPLLLATLAAAPLFAWTDTVEARVAGKAVQLAPADLALLVEKHQASFDRGLADAARGEGAESHYQYGFTRGKLRSTLDNEITTTISIMRQHRPMAEFVEHLGRIAHLVSDANNPFHTRDSDPRLASCRADFEAYQARRISTVPTVFYGLDITDDLGSYLNGMIARSAEFYPLLSEEYFRFGERRSSADFDDRSTAYGIAAVSYSHAVTDLVNIYFYIWKKAGGDVRHAPLMKSGNLILDETTIGAYKQPSPGKVNHE